MSNSLLDLNHEWFRPLWRRVLVTAVTLGWGIYEFISATPSWGVLFVALGIWCGWCFFGPNPYYKTKP